MTASHPHGHNGDGLSLDEQRKLWDHVRALEVLEEQAAEIRLDQKSRRELAKADGFDTNMIALVLKRRKAGEGETRAADNIIRMYEEGLREQGALPLERTRQPAVPPRRTVEEIADDLHGEPPPPMPEKIDTDVQDAAKALDDLCRENGTTATVSVDGRILAAFGEPERPSMFDED